MRVARGDRGEPGAGGVHERPPVADAPQVEAGGPPTRGRELERLIRVVGKLQRTGKSFAVPTGTTPSGTRASLATSAAQPIDPSPPATITRSGDDSTASSAWPSSKRATSSPRARNPLSTPSAPPDPESGLASRAITRAQVGIFDAALAALGGALVGGLARGLERLLRQIARLTGKLPRRALARPEGLVDALLRPPRGARQQEREDREDDADGDYYGDGQEGSLSLATEFVVEVPHRAGRENRAQCPPVDTGQQVDAYERQFRRAGLPMFVEGFSASTDVFTRAAPVLGLVFVGELLGAGNLDWTWWQNLLAIAGAVAFVCAAIAAVNMIQGRPARAIPQRIGRTELAAFVILPALLPLIFGGQVGSAATTIGANLLLLALIYAIFVFGLLAILRWVFGRLAGQLRSSLGLLANAVPLLAIFALLSFASQEMWQIFGTLSAFAYVCTVGLFVLLGSGFLAARVPVETRRLEREASSDGPPLSRSQRVNVGLVLFVSQAVQVLFVSVFIGAFFVLFGMLAIDDQAPHLVARRSGQHAGHGLDRRRSSSSSPRSCCGWPAGSPPSRASTLRWRCSPTRPTARSSSPSSPRRWGPASALASPTCACAPRGACRYERDDDRRLPPPARQPLRLDRAAQPARLRRDRDLRGDGARARRGRLLLLRADGGPVAVALHQRARRPARGAVLRAHRRRPRASRPSTTRSASWEAARAAVDAGRPALLLTDLYYLDHYGRSAHFPGHAVILAGYDDEVAYLSDTGLRGSADDEARAPGRGAPRPASGVPARRADAHGPRPRGAATTPARRAAGAIERNARQMIEPAMGDYEGLPGLRRFAEELPRWPRGARGLAVVGALLLPGDRAPRHGRRQLPAHVLALPRGGRARPRRGSPPRPRRGWTTLAGSLLEASEADEPDAALWSRDRRRGRGGARGRRAPLAGARGLALSP